MPFVYKEVEVEIDLDDFSDSDLIKELEYRNLTFRDIHPEENRLLVERMYDKYRMKQDISEELREFFWRTIGKIV